MTRSCDARLLAFALAAALAVAATPAVAGTEAKPTPVAAEKAAGADAAICTDGSSTDAQRAERAAKLADLGRRLHAEAAVQRDIQVLNRTGLNYSDRRMPPPAKAPAPTQP
jgi:hypothetical protein